MRKVRSLDGGSGTCGCSVMVLRFMLEMTTRSTGQMKFVQNRLGQKCKSHEKQKLALKRNVIFSSISELSHMRGFTIGLHHYDACHQQNNANSYCTSSSSYWSFAYTASKVFGCIPPSMVVMFTTGIRRGLGMGGCAYAGISTGAAPRLAPPVSKISCSFVPTTRLLRGSC